MGDHGHKVFLPQSIGERPPCHYLDLPAHNSNAPLPPGEGPGVRENPKPIHDSEKESKTI